ncbi:MAG: phage portal protein [Candidatus Acidiferrales bacterium]
MARAKQPVSWLGGMRNRLASWISPEAPGAAKSKRNLTLFNGSLASRLTADWVNAPILSADQEIKGNLRILRGRARELSRNNPVAKSYLKILTANVLGRYGIGYQPMVRNNSDELNDGLNAKIQKAWRDWSGRGECTVDGKLSLRAVQSLVLQTVATDGEAFVRLVPGFDNKYRFALQLIDADQVDPLFYRYRSENGATPRGDGNEIRMGVEVDVWGRPVAYHVNPAHPSDLGGSLLRERIKAEYILHLYDPLRVQQTRGIPWFTPVMLELRMLGGYMEAELVASRVCAAKMGFFKHTDASAFEAQNDDAHYHLDAQPGELETLPPGLDFQSWDPQHPNSSFAAFLKATLRFIAGGLGVSYNALAADLEGVNYSSMRSGLLIERDQWKICQTFMEENFLAPVFKSWISMALLSGELVLDSRDPSRFLAGKWEARGWPWVDPLKDVQASILGIGAGLKTRDRVISEEGGDVEEVFAQIKREKELAEEYGLDFTIAAKPPIVNKGPKDSETPSDEEPDEPDATVEAQAGGRKFAVLGKR